MLAVINHLEVQDFEEVYNVTFEEVDEVSLELPAKYNGYICPVCWQAGHFSLNKVTKKQAKKKIVCDAKLCLSRELLLKEGDSYNICSCEQYLLCEKCSIGLILHQKEVNTNNANKGKDTATEIETDTESDSETDSSSDESEGKNVSNEEEEKSEDNEDEADVQNPNKKRKTLPSISNTIY